MRTSLTVSALCAVFTAITASPGKAPLKQLNDGYKIPSLALSLSTFGFDDYPKVRQSFKWAVENGYRHFDTATLYENEEEIGKGIADVIKKGLVQRDDLFITTKLWNDKHRREQVVPALKESLKKLGLQYVDLYLIYSPQSSNSDGSLTGIDYLETWQGMEEARRLGLVKSIGVCDFNTKQIDRIIANSKVVPAINQIEVHPFNTHEDLVHDCQERGIHVMAYTPLGFFVTRGGPGTPGVNDTKVQNIAKKYHKSVTQVVLRYSIDRDLIPIPKSTNQKHIEVNINIFDFQLTPAEVATISSFNTNSSVFD